MRIGSPGVDEHAADDSDERSENAHVQPRFGDGSAGAFGVAASGSEKQVRAVQRGEPADAFADHHGALHVADAVFLPAVEGGEDLRDGLREEEDGAEAESRPESGGEEDGFGEEQHYGAGGGAGEAVEDGWGVELGGGEDLLARGVPEVFGAAAQDDGAAGFFDRVDEYWEEGDVDDDLDVEDPAPGGQELSHSSEYRWAESAAPEVEQDV